MQFGKDIADRFIDAEFADYAVKACPQGGLTQIQDRQIGMDIFSIDGTQQHLHGNRPRKVKRAMNSSPFRYQSRLGLFFAHQFNFRMQIDAQTTPGGFLNMFDQIQYISSPGIAGIDDKAGMFGGHLGAADLESF